MFFLNNKKMLGIGGVCLWGAMALHGQGSLIPPSGAPAATMKTLTEVYDRVDQLQLPESAMVELISSPIARGGFDQLGMMFPEASVSSSYTIPAGKVLVITDIAFYSSTFPTSANALVVLQQVMPSGALRGRRSFNFSLSEPFLWSLNTGMRFSSGSIIRIENASAAGTPNIEATMTGYLVNDT